MCGRIKQHGKTIVRVFCRELLLDLELQMPKTLLSGIRKICNLKIEQLMYMVRNCLDVEIKLCDVAYLSFYAGPPLHHGPSRLSR